MPEVHYRKTTLTRAEARACVTACFAELFGRAPEPQELALLLAQSEHETAGWKRMPNWNWGGIKAFKSWQDAGKSYRVHMTVEGKGADEKRVPQPFRAYGSAEDGCRDWLSVLARLWPTAMAVLRSGDADAAKFVDGLRHGLKGAYFTGDSAVYTRSVESLAARWREQLQVSGPPPTIQTTARPGTYVSVPGYHRAKQSEVTTEMTNAAKAALRELELGEIRYGRGFALACETHSNAAKGISVFLPDGGAK